MPVRLPLLSVQPNDAAASAPGLSPEPLQALLPAARGPSRLGRLMGCMV